MRCRQAKSVKAGNSKAAACYKDIKKRVTTPLRLCVVTHICKCHRWVLYFSTVKRIINCEVLLLYQNDTVSALVAEIELDAVYSIAIWYIQVLAAVLCNIVIGSRVIIGTAP